MSFCKESEYKSVDWVYNEQVRSYALIYLLGKKDKELKEENPKGYDLKCLRLPEKLWNRFFKHILVFEACWTKQSSRMTAAEG